MSWKWFWSSLCPASLLPLEPLPPSLRRAPHLVLSSILLPSSPPRHLVTWIVLFFSLPALPAVVSGRWLRGALLRGWLAGKRGTHVPETGLRFSLSARNSSNAPSQSWLTCTRAAAREQTAVFCRKGFPLRSVEEAGAGGSPSHQRGTPGATWGGGHPPRPTSPPGGRPGDCMGPSWHLP